MFRSSKRVLTCVRLASSYGPYGSHTALRAYISTNIISVTDGLFLNRSAINVGLPLRYYCDREKIVPNDQEIVTETIIGGQKGSYNVDTILE